ncbi:hypothetical protein Fot_23091 [Forsythia ovata]|uniref:Uncharacterized protein n=1 Tax=Forsythia ovata TaxID=205694 RepID=A0ABD1UZK1_9LAMI
MNIAFEAGVTCTKSSIPSQEPVNTSTFLEDKEKENKVIGIPSHRILEPITGKEKMKIPIREDIQDIKNSECSSSPSQTLPKLTIKNIDSKDIVKICHEFDK